MQKKRFQVQVFSSAHFPKTVLNVLLLATMTFTIMSFTTDTHFTNAGTDNKSKKDSISSDKNFQTLLGNIIVNEPIGLNPNAVAFVNDFISKEAEEFDDMKTWGRPYFDMYDKILADNGIPKELKYLSVIESNLRSRLVSGAGAVGPWQLMHDEAKRYGLKVKKGVDERTNFYKSTEVASKLLKGLYSEFGDWLLVIAAYNAGSGRVKQAIRKAGSRNFWELQYFLPAETRNHVKKYIATHYYFEGCGGFTTMTANELADYKAANTGITQVTLSDEELKATETTDITGKYNSTATAAVLQMEAGTFNRLNPLFDKMMAEGQTYHLRLPKDKVSLFKDKKIQILQQSVQVLLAPVGMPSTAKK